MEERLKINKRKIIFVVLIFPLFFLIPNVHSLILDPWVLNPMPWGGDSGSDYNPLFGLSFDSNISDP
jgi:hypothetical protein